MQEVNFREVGKGMVFGVLSNLWVTQNGALRNAKSSLLTDQQEKQMLPLMLGIAAFIYALRNNNMAALGYSIGMLLFAVQGLLTVCHDLDPNCRTSTSPSP